jgi:radical SAM superfamily enzyme YgiQ (UPF0313 family)
MKYSDFKVLLIYANEPFTLLMPIGISSIAAKLKQERFDVKVFDTTFYRTDQKAGNLYRESSLQVCKVDYSEVGIKEREGEALYRDFLETVMEYKPSLVGLSSTEVTHNLGITLLKLVADRGIVTMVGGVHTTFNPDEVLSEKCVDIICIGEGELAIAELCKRMADGNDYLDIPNIWVKANGRVYRNRYGELEDLTKLPLPDFEVFDSKRIYRQMAGSFYRMLPIEFSRGCIYNCAYCSAPAYATLFGGIGKWYRIKDLDQIFREIELGIEKFQVEYFYIVSETFLAMPGNVFDEFVKRYQKIRIPFWFNTRPETINKEVVGKLEEANCHRMSIGIECGNEKYRRDMLKRNVSNEKIIDVCKIVEKSTVKFSVNNIIGFPDETREMILDTIKVNRAFVADSHSCSIFQPFGGTPLRQYCVDKQYIDREFRVSDFYEPSLNMPSITKEEIKGLFKTFQLYIRCDEEDFDDIQKAEKDTEDGDEMFKFYSKKLLSIDQDF